VAVEGFYGYQLAYIQNRKLSEKNMCGICPYLYTASL